MFGRGAITRAATDASSGKTWYFLASAMKVCFVSLTFSGFKHFCRQNERRSSETGSSETEMQCHSWHAVVLFFGLQGGSPENGSFPGFGRRLLGVLAPQS